MSKPRSLGKRVRAPFFPRPYHGRRLMFSFLKFERDNQQCLRHGTHRRKAGENRMFPVLWGGASRTIGRREPGQSSPYCEGFLLSGATSPPGTIKTIGFRLPTCRASNFPRTAGKTPHIGHKCGVTAAFPVLWRGKRSTALWQGLPPNEKPLCDFHTGALERPSSPQNGERPREPLEEGSLSSLRLNCPSTRTSRFPSSRQWRSSRTGRRRGLR